MALSQDTWVPRISGGFSILSIAATLAAFGIGSSRGLLPPTAFDFSNANDLTRLAADSRAHTLPLALSLVAPCLAIPVGLGWFHVLRPAGSYAVCGVAMFFVGMIFVVLLDALELTLIVDLAPAYGSADGATKPALLAVAETMERTRRVFSYVGHFFGFGLGQLALGLAILRVGRVPRWLGWLSFVPAILLGWVATLMEFSGGEAAVGPIVAVGVLAFTGWFLSMGVVLIRWMPEENLDS
jgi:hypothetical protein